MFLLHRAKVKEWLCARANAYARVFPHYLTGRYVDHLFLFHNLEELNSRNTREHLWALPYLIIHKLITNFYLINTFHKGYSMLKNSCHNRKFLALNAQEKVGKV